MRPRDISINFIYDNFVEILSVIDKQLERMFKLADKDFDYADAFGLIDLTEDYIGLGFVVCQTYMTNACGILGLKKEKAFSYGKKKVGNFTISEIINHGANHWKHKSELPDKTSNRLRKKREKIFAEIGVPAQDGYPLSNVLAKICFPKELSLLVVQKKLKVWTTNLSDNI